MGDTGRGPAVLNWECLPGAEGLAKWRAGVDELFPPLYIEPKGDVFRARLRSARGAALQLTDIESVPQRVIRRAGTSTKTEFFKVSLQISGEGTFRQNGQETLLRPGSVAVYDTSRPYEIEFDSDYRFLVATFSESGLPRSFAALSDLAGHSIAQNAGIGSIWQTYFKGLFGELPLLSSSSGDSATRAFFELLDTFVSEQMSGESYEELDSKTLLRIRILQHLDEHLDEPDLTPGVVAQAHHISVRQLHRLFENGSESVSGHIRRRRMERARRELADPARAAVTVGEIARRVGYGDQSAFGRAFRDVHGMSPAAWRDAQRLHRHR